METKNSKELIYLNSKDQKGTMVNLMLYQRDRKKKAVFIPKVVYKEEPWDMEASWAKQVKMKSSESMKKGKPSADLI